jgi:hypothetical protein
MREGRGKVGGVLGGVRRKVMESLREGVRVEGESAGSFSRKLEGCARRRVFSDGIERSVYIFNVVEKMRS